MSETKLVPELRFPEFESEWTQDRLGAITSWSSGGTPSKEKAEYWNGNIPWISASTMWGNEYSESDLSITETGLKNGSRLAKKDSLLLLVRGSMLFNKIPVGIALKNLAFNQDVKAIEVSEVSSPRFLLYWFGASESKLLNLVTGTGIGAGKLDLADLKSLDIFYPGLAEQQKIAAFLTAVDEKLQALKKKKSLLEEYKKGLMQKIFSQELRFKDEDGKDFPDWEVKKLGDVMLEGKLGGNYENSEANGGIPVIKMGNLGRGSINLDKVQYLPADEPFNQDDILKEGDLLFNTRNTLELVGKVSIWRNEIPLALYNSNLMRMKLNGQFEPTNRFANYLLNSKKAIKQLRSFATGTTSVAAIYSRDLQAFELTCPSIAEQTKIANFLSIIDRDINYTSNQIKKMGKWKAGILQVLFT